MHEIVQRVGQWSRESESYSPLGRRNDRRESGGWHMSIGLGVLLIVVGAILAFAIDVDLQVFDGYVLGWILIVGGILAIVLGFVQQAQRNRSTHVVEERRDDER